MDLPHFIIAVQVRAGSTRLPGKMLRPFWNGKAIPLLIIEELLRHFEPTRIVVASTVSQHDDAIEDLVHQAGVECFRGSEQDVLDRILQAVGNDPAEFVVRVCGDNPFIRGEYIAELLTLISEDYEPCDYASFQLNDGTPVILSHLGLFAEIVRKAVLTAIHSTSSQPRHREHITSHILDNPHQYQRRLLPVPGRIESVEGLRLTVDTERDFENCRELYSDLVTRFGPRFSVDNLLDVVTATPGLLLSMADEIEANWKR